jgi:hypothetical protein
MTVASASHWQNCEALAMSTQLIAIFHYPMRLREDIG